MYDFNPDHSIEGQSDRHPRKPRTSTPLHSMNQGGLSSQNNNMTNNNNNRDNSHSQQHGSSRLLLQELQARVGGLERELSDVKLENEILRHELEQARAEIEEKQEIQARMRQQLDTVTQTAYMLYNKFRAFKGRYYEEQTRGFNNNNANDKNNIWIGYK